jgi:4-hydroxy-tetrahydrodipicolinate synthase
VAQAAQLGAILTAMVTPFDRDGELNEGGARRLARHLVDHGSDGIVVAGTTGESPTLSDEEKLRLLDIVLEEVGDEATVVFGSGSNNTAHSVHLTAEGTRHGAHALLAVTPYYNKPSRRGLLEHFRAVAASTDRPVMLYNIPARCVINLDPDLLADLGEIENVVAVKQANDDLDQARQIVDNGLLALYAGDDNLVCRFAEIGGAGGVCVTSHLLGERMKEMYEAARGGDVARAHEIDAELEDAYKTLFMTVGVTMTKAALNMLDLDVGAPRLPLVEASEEEQEAARKMLERHGLLAAAAR